MQIIEMTITVKASGGSVNREFVRQSVVSAIQRQIENSGLSDPDDEGGCDGFEVILVPDPAQLLFPGEECASRFSPVMLDPDFAKQVGLKLYEGEDFDTGWFNASGDPGAARVVLTDGRDVEVRFCLESVGEYDYCDWNSLYEEVWDKAFENAPPPDGAFENEPFPDGEPPDEVMDFFAEEMCDFEDNRRLQLVSKSPQMLANELAIVIDELCVTTRKMQSDKIDCFAEYLKEFFAQ